MKMIKLFLLIVCKQPAVCLPLNGFFVPSFTSFYLVGVYVIIFPTHHNLEVKRMQQLYTTHTALNKKHTIFLAVRVNHG